MELKYVPNGKGKIIYDIVNHIMNGRGILSQSLIARFTYGASTMVGNENGFVSLKKKDVPNLIVVHCIAHRKALSAADASKHIQKLLHIEKLANKVYSWIQNSPKRSNELNDLLRVMEIDALDVLQIHVMRWLSR